PGPGAASHAVPFSVGDFSHQPTTWALNDCTISLTLQLARYALRDWAAQGWRHAILRFRRQRRPSTFRRSPSGRLMTSTRLNDMLDSLKRNRGPDSASLDNS